MMTLTKLMTIAGLMMIPLAHAEVEEKPALEAGPNGGRVITSVEPSVEFFVMPDRKLQLTFLGEDGKAIAVAEQSVTGIGGDRSNPTRFKFTKAGDVLVSDAALPDGNMIPLILQFKMTSDADRVTEKFSVDFSNCPSCEHKEYACTCGH